MKKRYKQAGRKERGRLLDEVEAVTELHRKSLIRLMNGSLERKPRRRQRSRTYGPEVDDALRVISESLDHICAERITPTWSVREGLRNFDRRQKAKKRFRPRPQPVTRGFDRSGVLAILLIPQGRRERAAAYRCFLSFLHSQTEYGAYATTGHLLKPAPSRPPKPKKGADKLGNIIF